MNFITTDPVKRAITGRAYYGVNGGIVVVTLACGHTFAGLVKDEFAPGEEYLCSQCGIQIAPEGKRQRATAPTVNAVTQLSLFAA